jgi:chaperonin cofactor prefoldin
VEAVLQRLAEVERSLAEERATRIRAERELSLAGEALETARKEALAASEKGTAASEKKSDATEAETSDWELRAVKQLEEDIETYRKRIRTLLADRDSLQEKNSQLAYQLEAASQPPVPITAPNAGGPAPSGPNELQNRITALKQERNALDKARLEALQQLEDVRSGKAELEAAVANMSTEAQTQEILALRQQLEKAAREIQQLKNDKELLSEIKKNELDNSEKPSAVSDRTVQGLRRSIDAQSKAVSALTRERDSLSEERDTLSKDLDASRSAHQAEV